MPRKPQLNGSAVFIIMLAQLVTPSCIKEGLMKRIHAPLWRHCATILFGANRRTISQFVLQSVFAARALLFVAASFPVGNLWANFPRRDVVTGGVLDQQFVEDFNDAR